MSLQPHDAAHLHASGRSPELILGQLDVLRRGPRYRKLVRPCSIGDGIVQLSSKEIARYRAAAASAAAAGRLVAFVPASGAATRLLSCLSPDVLARTRELALWDELELPADASTDAIDAALQQRFSGVPKALVPFHRGPEGIRSAFEEHLAEAALLVADADHTVRVHFTVGAEHELAFRQHLLEVQGRLERAFGVKLNVEFSTQAPATDTAAVDGEGELIREGDAIVFRPGGHGALLQNLAACGDLAIVKNIDNVVAEPHRPEVAAWRATLIGCLVDLERRVHEVVRDLTAGKAVEHAAARVAAELGIAEISKDRAWLLSALNRPLRVCGMVQNDGQPGGGPFFVDDTDRPQIVEAAEVDPRDVAQQAIWRGSTHFNPVDIAVSLCDAWGKPWDVAAFADPHAAIVTRKTHQGRTMTVLEHPGLWNGAMAGWNSVFVELPRSVFQPVKSLGDLLAEGHRS